MSKRFSRMAALSLTLPLIAATFASCGEDGSYRGVNSNSNYTYNYKTEAEENYSPNTVNPNERLWGVKCDRNEACSKSGS